MPSYSLHVESEFSAAHQLREYRGHCENLHGHNWRVRLTVSGETLSPLGLLMDFADLKALLNKMLARLDHRFLNEISPFDEINPTVENLSRYIAESLTPQMPGGVGVEAVTVWESEKCSATWRI